MMEELDLKTVQRVRGALTPKFEAKNPVEHLCNAVMFCAITVLDEIAKKKREKTKSQDIGS